MVLEIARSGERYMAWAGAQPTLLNLADKWLVVGRALRVVGDQIVVSYWGGQMGGRLALWWHEWREQLKCWEGVEWVWLYGVGYHLGGVCKARQELMWIIGR